VWGWGVLGIWGLVGGGVALWLLCFFGGLVGVVFRFLGVVLFLGVLLCGLGCVFFWPFFGVRGVFGFFFLGVGFLVGFFFGGFGSDVFFVGRSFFFFLLTYPSRFQDSPSGPRRDSRMTPDQHSSRTSNESQKAPPGTPPSTRFLHKFYEMFRGRPLHLPGIPFLYTQKELKDTYS